MSKIGQKAAHFITQKPWTPWRRDNQERIWAAEQAAKTSEEKEKTRAELIRRAADVEEQAKLLKYTAGDPSSIGQSPAHPLHFMYAPPPGYVRSAADEAAGSRQAPITLPSTAAAVQTSSTASSTGKGGSGSGSDKSGGETKPSAAAVGSRGLSGLLAAFGGGGSASSDGGGGGAEVEKFMAAFSAATSKKSAPVAAAPLITGTTSGGEADAADAAPRLATSAATEVAAVHAPREDGGPLTATWAPHSGSAAAVMEVVPLVNASTEDNSAGAAVEAAEPLAAEEASSSGGGGKGAKSGIVLRPLTELEKQAGARQKGIVTKEEMVCGHCTQNVYARAFPLHTVCALCTQTLSNLHKPTHALVFICAHIFACRWSAFLS